MIIRLISLSIFSISLISLIATNTNAKALSLPITYAKIKNIIESENIQSIECLLTKLPKEYMEGHMLFHSSRGLQDSTFQAPRAVIYGNDAKFVMAFNGDPGQFRYEFLEMIEYNENAPKNESPFTLFEIIFPANEKFNYSNDEPCKTLDGIENRANTSIQKNPTKCIGCHSDFPSPIFEGHPLMPGAYGELADTLHTTPISTEGRSNDRIRDDTKIESQEIIKFIERAKTHPRYRNLHNLDYSDESAIPHNGRLQALFAKLNFERIDRVIRNSEVPGADTPLYQLYMISIFSRCYKDSSDFSTHLPPNATLANPEPNLFNIYTPDKAQTDLIFSQLFEGIGIGAYGLYIGFDISERIGFETATNFRINWKGKPYQVTWLNELFSVFAKNNKTIAKLFTITKLDNPSLKTKNQEFAIPNSPDTLCADFKTNIRTLLALGEVKFPKHAEENTHASPREWVSPDACIKCHSGEDRFAGLEIPFANGREAFEKWALADNKFWASKILSVVKKNSSGKARMPLKSGLSEEEISQYETEDYDHFIQYLNTLLKTTF